MLNPHLFLEALRVNGELKKGALSLSRSQFNLLKIVIFGNMTIWIWQLFWKFNKYDNLQYDNYFEHVKIWQFVIWQLFWKNCHIWISKYDKKKNLCSGFPDTAFASRVSPRALRPAGLAHLRKMTKIGTKKSTQPRKKLKFCMKNWKPSYLWGFWKKSPTPNFIKLLNP